jgi:hypothetical protein
LLQALGDLALALGVVELDALAAPLLLPQPHPHCPLPHDAERRNQKALLPLLLELLREWADNCEAMLAAAKSKSKKGRRRTEGGNDPAAQAALGAALVEALARLVCSHLHWVQRQVQAGRQLAMDDLQAVQVSWLPCCRATPSLTGCTGAGVAGVQMCTRPPDKGTGQ